MMIARVSARALVCAALICCQATSLCAQEASPLNTLDPKHIPADERFAWQPKELVAVLGSHRGRHWSAIRGLAFSPDGQKIASIGNDHAVRLWDAATLRELAEMPLKQTARYGQVSFAPDGKTLYASGAAWDISGPEPKATADGPVGPAFFSKAGKHMLAVDKRGMALFERAGDKLKELDIVPVGKLADAYHEPLGLSGDGRVIVIRKVEKGGYPGPLQLWEYNAAKKAIERREDFGKKVGFALDREKSVGALSPDGRWLVVGDTSGRTSAVALWDLSKPKLVPTYLSGVPMPRIPISSFSTAHCAGVAFSPDGKFLFICATPSYNQRGTTAFYSVNENGGFIYRGRLAVEFDQYAMAMSPNGKVLATAGSDHAIHLWRWPTHSMTEQLVLPYAAEHVAFLEEGKTLLAASKSGQALWDLTAKDATEKKALAGVYRALATSADGRWLAGQANTTPKVRFERIKSKLVLVDLQAKEPASFDVAETEHGIQCAAFTPDGKTLAYALARSPFTSPSGDDKSGVYLASVGVRPVAKEVLAGPHEPILAVAVAADGKLLAAASGKPVFQQSRAVGLEGQVHVWDISGAKVGPPVVLSDDGARTVAFSPKERLLAAGGPEGFALWDLSKEKPLRLAQIAVPIHNAAFSPDGQWLLTGSETTAQDGSVVQIWQVADLRKGQSARAPFASLGGGTNGTSAVAFAPDGKKLAVALRAAPSSSNFSIHLWDFPSDGGIRPLLPQDICFEAGDLAWTPDGKTLVSGGYDRKLRLWDFTQSPPVARVVPYWNEPIRSVAVSASGKHLAAAGPNGAAVWTLSDKGWSGKRWLPYEGSVYGLALAADGRSLLIGGYFHEPPRKKGEKNNERENHYNLWDLSKLLPKRASTAGTAQFLAATPDAALLAFNDSNNGMAQLATFQGGELKFKSELKGNAGFRTALAPIALAPNGKYLVAHDHSSYGASLWRFEPTMERIATLTGKHEDGRYRHSVAAFSPDSKLAAVLSYQDRVVLFDTETGKEAHSWELPNSAKDPSAMSSNQLLQRGLAFAPDGRHLALSNVNGTIYILRLR